MFVFYFWSVNPAGDESRIQRVNGGIEGATFISLKERFSQVVRITDFNRHPCFRNAYLKLHYSSSISTVVSTTFVWSKLGCQIPDLMCQVPDLLCQVLDLMCLVLDLLGQVLDYFAVSSTQFAVCARIVETTLLAEASMLGVGVSRPTSFWAGVVG